MPWAEVRYCLQDICVIDLTHEKLICFVEKRSRVTQMYITKIRARSILALVVKWHHHANMQTSYFFLERGEFWWFASYRLFSLNLPLQCPVILWSLPSLLASSCGLRFLRAALSGRSSARCPQHIPATWMFFTSTSRASDYSFVTRPFAEAVFIHIWICIILKSGRVRRTCAAVVLDNTMTVSRGRCRGDFIFRILNRLGALSGFSWSLDSAVVYNSSAASPSSNNCARGVRRDAFTVLVF